MIGVLQGPWLLCAALLLLAVAVWRGSRPRVGELWWVGAITVGAAVARLVWGVWGPLHVNGQGPLWIRGALDAETLVNYGPGYYELFGWVARLGSAPDRALFAANALLSALSPALLYAVARLTGVARGGALAAAMVLAADAVIVRTAASELYVTPLITLVLAVQVSLALLGPAHLRGDRLAGRCALAAAGLLGAATARIHPIGYLPLAISPLVVLCAARPASWRARLVLAAGATGAIGAAVLLTSGGTVINALEASSVGADAAVAGLQAWHAALLTLLLVGVWGVHRWARPPWLPLLTVGSVFVMLVIADSFRRHPFQALFYVRLCWPGLLLGAAALLPRRLQGAGWVLGVVAAVVVIVQVHALPYLAGRTTEQLEYAFLQEVLPRMPANCTLASVSRTGKRVWAIPSYLVPSQSFQDIGSASDLRDAFEGADCLVYVHSSLCTSAEGRALCESAEREIPLDRVDGRVFPAAPSDVDLPYDRSAVEVAVFRATGQGGRRPPPQAVSGGVAITPAFAQALYERVAPLRESDGCRLVRFDTSRFSLTVGLQARAGTVHAFELASAPAGGGRGRRAGDWTLAVPAALETDCGATLAAIEQVLAETSAPRSAPWGTSRWTFAWTNHSLLAASFVLLVLGTLHLLSREAQARRPSPSAVVALVLVWGAALGLRLWLSPRTFLHEYYHIAETISGYLTGENAPAYGSTGPALFRLAGAALGRPEDVQIIFLTNAAMASLAIPAVALLDLALMRSWPRALCAAVLLCVLPQHLRFSAGEDLFVLALTFGLWALALFALYLRTRRLEDALLGALALSLAMQARPEMLFFPAALVALLLLMEPRSWRVLLAWRTLLALSALGTLLIPRFFELQRALQGGPAPALRLPDLHRYVNSLVLFQPQVTPTVYWVLLAVGLVCGAVRTPRLLVWVALVFFGYTLFSFSIFDNPPYHLRTQLLPTSFVVLVAAGAAPVWMALWGRRRRLALVVGACALVGLGAAVVTTSRGFVTELRDQQLEWAFLERTVPQLPERVTLLSAVEIGGHNIDAFPELLLRRANKTYRMVDVRRAVDGDVAWPTPGEDLLYYQGMFCYFAFGEEPPPDPMTAACQAVHEHYAVEPLIVEDLNTQGYSWLRYARGPFRIGFFRLRAQR